MDISLIATLVVVLYVVATSAIQLLKARRRSWLMAVIRLGITLLCAIVSFPLTRYVMNLLSSEAFNMLRPNLGETLLDFIDRVPVGAEGVRVLVSLLVSPILYLLIFLVLRFILTLIAWIVSFCVPVLRIRDRGDIAMPVGAANGLIFALITLVPLCGYLAMGSALLDTVVDTGLTQSAVVQESFPDVTEEDVIALSDALGGHPVVAVIDGTVGGPLFSAMTTAKLDKEITHGVTVKINLERELCGFVTTLSNAMDAVDSFKKENYTEADKQILFDAADSLFASEWISMLATDTLVTMADSWLDNKPFLGMDRPVMDATINPTVNCLLGVLATETPETLAEDIHLILDLVGDLKVYNLMDTDADPVVLAQRMGQSGLLTNMMSKLKASDRLYVLAEELEALSIRLVSSVLGVDELKNGEHAEVMEDIATALTDALEMDEAERDAWVKDALQENFGDLGYDIPEDVVLQVSHQVMDDLGADGEITPDELVDYLVSHADQAFDIVGDVEIPEGILP